MPRQCNTDPERARKRALTDLRCAAKKLIPWFMANGQEEAAETLTSALDEADRAAKEIES